MASKKPTRRAKPTRARSKTTVRAKPKFKSEYADGTTAILATEKDNLVLVDRRTSQIVNRWLIRNDLPRAEAVKLAKAEAALFIEHSGYTVAKS